MKKNIALLVLGVFALIGIVISFMGDVGIIGYVVKSTDQCVSAMERFDTLKEDYECKTTTEDGADIEWCMQDDLFIYQKVYQDGSKEWGFIEGGSSEKHIYNNTKKICE